MLHYKAVARSKLWKISDICLGIFGVIAMTYATSLTVLSWAQSSGPGAPTHCNPNKG